jgi:hypothetical protein
MNFMDGRNGVYGSKATRGTIYGPYGLSGTLAYGWWAFLASPRSRSLYRRLGAHRLTSTGPEDGSLHDRTLLLATYLASLL